MVKIGIYSIKNILTNQRYIGQSTHIYRRWAQHKNINNWKTGYKLYDAFIHYGIDNFEFKIIEECSRDQLNEREIYWINFYDTFYNGYNLTTGGDSGRRYIKLSSDAVNNIIKDLKGTELTGKEIAKKYGVNNDTISMINNGRLWYTDTLTYPIRDYTIKQVKAKSHTIHPCIDCNKPTTGIRCHKCNLKYKASHRAITLSKEDLAKLIYKIGFIKVGKQFGITDTAVRKLCKSLGLPNHTKDLRLWCEQNFSLASLME